MYLKYGSYSHASAECTVAISKEGLFSDSGVSLGIRERWDIQGRLAAADQSALTDAIKALREAYAKQGRDIGLYTDSGGLTDHCIKSSRTREGTRVVKPPSFPAGPGNEVYATYRNYDLAVEATHPDTNTGILTWSETINFRGTGGPVWGFLVPLAGPPQRQQLQEFSTVLITQAGFADGNGGYPSPAAPIWPQYEHQEARDIRKELPTDNTGRRRITWSYVFEAASPSTVNPTQRF